MIVVVDYGVNNLRSVVRALEASGHTASLATDPDVVRRADRVVLPGVGNFSRATHLAESGLADALRDVAASGRPLLGICLGLQLLFARSEEAPGVAGIGILEGEVRKFPAGQPVPHVGWSRVDATPAGNAHAAVAPLFAGDAPFYYHVHSYHPSALPAANVLGTAEYGELFPTLVGHGNVLGAQFHPEKSQHAGLAFLDAFARWNP